MKTRLTWQTEQLDEFSFRVKVYGGWLVVIADSSLTSMTSQFVADKYHEWTIVQPIQAQPANDEIPILE